jgi:formylglycine-generating enzyme required for sulfatase activity
MTNCGAGHAESCCTSPRVLGGTFGRLSSVTVSDFRLDKYLVTVGRFRQFVTAWRGGYVPPPGSGKHTFLNGGRGLVDGTAPPDAGSPSFETGWQSADNAQIAPTSANLACGQNTLMPQPSYTWTDIAAARENLPINCTNWYEAAAFCIWDGGFLPSGDEWLYAAEGGVEQRWYPWGSTAPALDTTQAIYDCLFPDSTGPCPAVAKIAPVGSAPAGAGKWGQLDLAGELWEWDLDYADPGPCQGIDCAVLTNILPPTYPSQRDERGGAFLVGGGEIMPSNPSGGAPTERGTYRGGFRCARAP